jgi:hypothetical protein
MALGDPDGAREIEETIATLTAAGDGSAVMHFRINLLIGQSNYLRPRELEGLLEDTAAFGRARGLRANLAWLDVAILQNRYEIGDLDRILADAPALDDELDHQGATGIQLDVRIVLLRIDVLRGIDPGAARLAWIERTARHTEAGESMVGGLGSVAAARVMLGDHDGARTLINEILAPGEVGFTYWFMVLPTLVRGALEMGDVGLAEALHQRVEPQVPLSVYTATAAGAAVLEARGDHAAAVDAYAEASQKWDDMGMVAELGYAHLGRGRSLLALGRPLDARASLDQARGIFAGLQAAPALREIEAVLATVRDRTAPS